MSAYKFLIIPIIYENYTQILKDLIILHIAKKVTFRFKIREKLKIYVLSYYI